MAANHGRPARASATDGGPRSDAERGQRRRPNVKTTNIGGERGYNGAKKITGRKRHIFVDTLGFLLAVAVTSAAVDDAAAGASPRASDSRRSAAADQDLGHSKYRNHGLNAWLTRERPDWNLEIVSRPAEAKGFVLLPKRWVAERTFSWTGRYRRHSKDYERRTASSESMLKSAPSNSCSDDSHPPTKFLSSTTMPLRKDRFLRGKHRKLFRIVS